MIPGHQAAGGPEAPAEAAANIRQLQLGLLPPALIELRTLLGLFPPVGTPEPLTIRTTRPSSMPPTSSTRRYWRNGKKVTFEPTIQRKGISQQQSMGAMMLHSAHIARLQGEATES